MKGIAMMIFALVCWCVFMFLILVQGLSRPEPKYLGGIAVCLVIFLVGQKIASPGEEGEST